MFMLDVRPLDLKTLSSDEKRVFKALSSRQGKLYLDYGEEIHKHKAYAAYEENQLIGFAVVSVIEFIGHSELEEFTLAPEWRKKGLGTRFLKEIQRELTQNGIASLIIKFESRSSSAPALNTILDKEGYFPQKILNQRYHFDSHGFNPQWLYGSYALPKGHERFPWHEITPREEYRLRERIGSWDLPDEISPYDAPPIPIEHSCSFGLRTEEGVMGWSVLHRVSQDTLRYSAFYVDPKLRFGLCAMNLLTASMFAHKRSVIPFAYFEINVEQIHQGWTRFVDMRLKPYAQAFSELVMRWKKFID